MANLSCLLKVTLFVLVALTVANFSHAKPAFPDTAAGGDETKARDGLQLAGRSRRLVPAGPPEEVLGARIRMQTVYSQYLSSPSGGSKGFAEYPCANVLHSHALKGLRTGPGGCAVLPTKPVEDSSSCFAELWMSAEKLSRASGLGSDVTSEVVFELRHSESGAFGSVRVDFSESRRTNRPWLALNISNSLSSFTRQTADSARTSVRICRVEESTQDVVPVTLYSLTANSQSVLIRQKPFIITGQHRNVRGLDDFVREHRQRRRRRRSNNPLRNLLERGDWHRPTGTSRPQVTTSAENDSATANGNQGNMLPCQRTPLNVTVADVLPVSEGQRIVFPIFLELNDCSGYCTKETEPASAHALLMREVRRRRLSSGHSSGCCVPIEFAQEPFALLIEKGRGEHSLHSDLRNPRVTACGCS